MRDRGSQLTIETLENMFVYLGCANIPTQVAMDGAVPVESLLNTGTDGNVISFSSDEIAAMAPSWDMKAVWFSGEHLSLSTVKNVHWSMMSMSVARLAPSLKLMGWSGKTACTNKSDGFVEVFYSEIDRFGQFVKFPVRKKYRDGVIVKKIYNPAWLLEFKGEFLHCISSDNSALYRQVRLPFLTPMLCGMAQSLGSYWLVKTRFDTVCPSLTLLTDPTGVKEFWKLRDVPPGRARRAALLHWVNSHWRQMRNDPDVETFVRKHMSGQVDIKQGNFEAVITPSVRDTVDAEVAKKEREMMRQRKEDRRRRRRLETRNHC